MDADMVMMMMMKKWNWQANEEVNWDKTGEADEMNLKVDSRDEVMHMYQVFPKK